MRKLWRLDKMKKILIGMLTFLIVGMATKIIVDVKNEKTLTNQMEQNPIERKERAFTPNNEINFSSSWIISAESTNENVQNYQSFSSVFKQEGQKEVFTQEGIKWNSQSDYKITAKLQSDQQARVTVFVKDGEEIIKEQSVEITGEGILDFSFNSLKDNDWTGKISVEIISESSESNKVLVETLRLIEINQTSKDIHVNQVGYLPNEEKRVVFPYVQGDFFDVINAQTGEVVYTGAILKTIWNESTKERNSFGDFSSFKEEGTYYIRSQISNISPTFRISNTIYRDVLEDSLRFISYQRCGTELSSSWAGEFAREACHTTDANLYESPGTTMNVLGGWHDAGDYGRYVETGSKTTLDLMMAYRNQPSSFNDKLNIEESGNSIPDLLDEVRYELEWFLKLQNSWGGIYHKVTTPSFALDILPEEDKEPLYLLSVETAATAGFITNMSLASVIYKDIDAEFAKRCLEAAKLSYSFLRGVPDLIDYKNPDEFSTGNYMDKKDNDERFLAAMALWSATHEQEYLDYAMEMFNGTSNASEGTSWSDVGAFGAYLYLTDRQVSPDSELYLRLMDSLRFQAQRIAAITENDGYQIGIDYYSWGSNGKILNQAIILLMVSNLDDNDYYRDLAMEQLNYIFGKNSLGMSFVVGYGEAYPQNPHHRVAKIKDIEMTGALVGGVNNDRDDPILSSLPETTAMAKTYVDSYDSYASNEVTIYWNSTLVYVLSFFQ